MAKLIFGAQTWVMALLGVGTVPRLQGGVVNGQMTKASSKVVRTLLPQPLNSPPPTRLPLPSRFPIIGFLQTLRVAVFGGS